MIQNKTTSSPVDERTLEARISEFLLLLLFVEPADEEKNQWKERDIMDPGDSVVLNWRRSWAAASSPATSS